LDAQADRKREFEVQLEDSKDVLHRLGLVRKIPTNLASGFEESFQANAFNVLSSLLNLVGYNISYFATFKRVGISKTGRLARPEFI